MGNVKQTDKTLSLLVLYHNMSGCFWVYFCFVFLFFFPNSVCGISPPSLPLCLAKDRKQMKSTLKCKNDKLILLNMLLGNVIVIVVIVLREFFDSFKERK